MASHRILFACLTAAVCMLAPLSVFAEETAPQSPADSGENSGNPAEPNDAFLIISHDLSCYNDSSKVYITSSTLASAVMAEIGIIDIQIQQSANGVNGWTTCVPEFDLTDTNVSAYYVHDYGVPVTYGYYYRVVVTHYAKETGFWFPQSQSVNQTSGVMRMI